MATVLSHKERSQRLAALSGQVLNLEALSRDAEALTADLMAAGFTVDEVAAAAAQLLTPLDTLRTNTCTMLAGISMVHQPVVKVGMPHGYTHAVLKAAGLMSPDLVTQMGTIRVPAAFEQLISPFSSFDVDDVISVTGTSGRQNDGVYRVYVKPNAVPSGEMISNPNIPDATDWTVSDGTITFAGDAAVFAASNATLKQLKADMATPWTTGTAYLVTVDVSAYTGGGIRIGTNSAGIQAVITTAGVHEVLVIADTHADGLVITAVSASLSVTSINMIPWVGLALYEELPEDSAQEDKLIITLAER